VNKNSSRKIKYDKEVKKTITEGWKVNKMGVEWQQKAFFFVLTTCGFVPNRGGMHQICIWSAVKEWQRKTHLG